MTPSALARAAAQQREAQKQEAEDRTLRIMRDVSQRYPAIMAYLADSERGEARVGPGPDRPVVHEGN